MNSLTTPWARLTDYAQLMRLDRPVGTLLLLWPTLWALWFASHGLPPLRLLVIFTAGTILMRSAGCVINDYADRDVDPFVARTRNRPLAARRLPPREALGLFVLLCLLALKIATPLPRGALLLSVPAVLLAASYPFAKRWHSMPQLHLALAFSWGIPMAFAAVRGEVDWKIASVLAGANMAWVLAYDTLYAMADREDDIKIGVKSTAILFGRFDRLAVAIFHLLALAFLVIAGLYASLQWPYYIGLGAAAGFAIREQYIVRARERDACFLAFTDNIGFGAAVFIGLLWTHILFVPVVPHPMAEIEESSPLNSGDCAPPPDDPEDGSFGYCVDRDIQFTPGGWPKALQADVFTPEGDGPFPAVLFVHGGSWRYGDRESMEPLAVALAQHGYLGVTVDYRLAPSFLFPAQLRDLQQALRWMRSNAKNLNLRPRHIGVWGFSSGAHLALMLGLVGPGGSLSMAGTRVQAVIGGGTPTDLAKFDDDDESTLLGVTREQDPDAFRRASPLYYADPTDPPVFLYHGDRDGEVPLVQAIAMKKALDKAGVEAELFVVHGGGHDFEPPDAFDSAVHFLDLHLKQDPNRPP